jgi:DNA-binding GntR family transcriptional regulator
MSTAPDRDTDAHVERIREHVRERVAAFRRGDLNAASEAHGRWSRAYAEAPGTVRERYWSTARAARTGRSPR